MTFRQNILVTIYALLSLSSIKEETRIRTSYSEHQTTINSAGECVFSIQRLYDRTTFNGVPYMVRLDYNCDECFDTVLIVNERTGETTNTLSIDDCIAKIEKTHKPREEKIEMPTMKKPTKPERKMRYNWIYLFWKMKA